MVKKPINGDYFSLTGRAEANSKAPNRVRITKHKNISSKGCNENWSREIFIIDSALKTNPWTFYIFRLKLPI